MLRDDLRIPFSRLREKVLRQERMRDSSNVAIASRPLPRAGEVKTRPNGEAAQPPLPRSSSASIM
jgi:hypothetical protein